MSESAGVRLVRCPKCSNLLPEVTEFSVYQCGGCGAVLRANDKLVELDTFSEDSYEDRVGMMKQRFPARYEPYDHKMDLYEKRMMYINDGYDSDRMSKISSSSRAENFRHGLMSKEEQWDGARNVGRGMPSDGRRVAREFGNLALYDEIEDRWERSSRVVRNGGLPTRYANSIFSEESGHSNHLSSPRHGYDFPIKNSYNRDGFDVGDEMDQLIRSGNFADRGKEKAYQNRYTENLPLMHRHELAGNGFHRPRFPSSRVQERLRPPMARRGPFQTSVRSNPYASGSYMDDGMVYLDQNVNQHHPSCSCFQCCNLRQGPPLVQTAIFSDEYSDVSVESRYSYPGNPVSSVQRRYNLRPTRMHLPIAGGAPFILCNYCLELLLLPRSSTSPSKAGIRRKVKCGVCSKVVVFTFSDNKLVFCIDEEMTNVTVKVDENGKRETFSTDDYDDMGCDFQAMDREPEQMLSVKARVDDSVQMKHRFSMSTHTTDLEEDTESEMENENVRVETSNKVELKAAKEHPPRAGASLQEHFEYSNIFRGRNSQGERKTSGVSKQGKHFAKKSIASQISVDSTMATETDVSSNELSNTGTSFGSGYASGKGRRQQSFFAGIMKKSVKESSKPNQSAEQEKAGVMVNGHVMADEMIKKAEKVAGPISQGSYWYDHRAGFWGAMGGPCLGMIPPGIVEFNYPMPEKCSGGDTNILVNGRELNQKDMNLLRRRGLPADRNRSYKVEISGRIMDNDTGEELESLGKLAPTIERIQRGFGMRVPKTAP